MNWQKKRKKSPLYVLRSTGRIGTDIPIRLKCALTYAATASQSLLFCLDNGNIFSHLTSI